MKGQPSYTAIGSMDLKMSAQVQVGENWTNLEEAGAGSEISWSNNRLDLSGIDDVKELRLSFASSSRLNGYEDAYSIATISQDVSFVVRQWNLASRTRRLHHIGNLIVTPSKGKVPGKIECSTSELTIQLSHFSGEIEIQPLLISETRMLDRRSSKGESQVYVNKGGILGWTDPVTIILDRARSGIDSMFDFRWVSFKDDGIPGLHDSEFFALRWESRPILYLNRDVEGLEDVLTCADKIGKRARARDTINSAIAHQALTVAISTSIYAAREINLKQPGLDVDQVTEVLSSLEKMVLRSWVHVVDDVSKGRSTPWLESMERLIAMEEDEVQRAIAELLPQNLQSELGSTKSVTELLKTFMERSGE